MVIRRVGHLAKVGPIGATETAITNDHTLDICIDVSTCALTELTEDQLEQASGGVQHTVTAPRDAVSGNATGRRSY